MKEILSVKELATELSCSVDFVYDAINKGDLRASRLGYGILRVTRENVETWLKNKESALTKAPR